MKDDFFFLSTSALVVNNSLTKNVGKKCECKVIINNVMCLISKRYTVAVGHVTINMCRYTDINKTGKGLTILVNLCVAVSFIKKLLQSYFLIKYRHYPNRKFRI